MKRRWSLTAALLLVLLVLAALWPLCQHMSEAAAHGAVSDKQRAVAQALEAQDEFETLGVGDAVLPILDIEDAWAIEDAREEAAEPLVTAMFSGGDALGYDAASATFYCALDTGDGQAWPALGMTARGARGVQVAWIDDYSYDDPADAMAGGYRYELLAYTGTQYAYIGVVFTGLPVVTLHTQQEITRADTAARVTIAAAGYEGLQSAALAHVRGAGLSPQYGKPQYRVELQAVSAKGKAQANAQSVLGMDAETDWLLIGGAFEGGVIRNRLCWQIWQQWTGEPQLGALETRLVELFLNDAYAGVYLLMEYVNPKKELELAGGDLSTDVCVRRIGAGNLGDRPRWQPSEAIVHPVELRYAPKGMSDEAAFGVFEPLSEILFGDPYVYSDEEFEQLVLSCFDLRELVEYYVFWQSLDLKDNYINNLYVWAIRQEDGSYRYRLSPWDMDRSLCLEVVMDEVLRGAEPVPIQREMQLAERLFDLDTQGIRAMLWDCWREKRAGVLSGEGLYALILGLENELNETGAPLREAQMTRGEETLLDISAMYDDVLLRLDMVEQFMQERWPLAGEADAQDAEGQE